MGCHSLFQGIFLTRGWNPRLLHWLHWFFTPGPPGKPLLPSSSVGRWSGGWSPERAILRMLPEGTQTHTLGETPRRLVVQSVSARRRTPGFAAPLSVWGPSAVSRRLFYRWGSKEKGDRGLRDSFPLGIAVPCARHQVALSARAGDRVVRRQPQFGILPRAASLAAQTVKYLPAMRGKRV